MRCLVVCESMFGNTRAVGDAIAESLAARGIDTEVRDVGEASPDVGIDVDLLIVGAPTHGHGLSKPDTRADVAKRTANQISPSGTGVREWLAELTPARPGQQAAAFDTRFDKPRWITGSAAQRAAKMLRRAGCRVITAPTSFFVTATTGPLGPGELERARRWAEALVSMAKVGQPGPAS